MDNSNYFVSIFIIRCSYYRDIDALGRDAWAWRHPPFIKTSLVVQSSKLFIPPFEFPIAETLKIEVTVSMGGVDWEWKLWENKSEVKGNKPFLSI